MIELLAAAEIYLASCTCATNPTQFECVMVYRAGDPDWDSEAPDADDVEGGGYIDSSKAARDPMDRGETDGLDE